MCIKTVNLNTFKPNISLYINVVKKKSLNILSFKLGYRIMHGMQNNNMNKALVCSRVNRGKDKVVLDKYNCVLFIPHLTYILRQITYSVQQCEISLRTTINRFLIIFKT